MWSNCEVRAGQAGPRTVAVCGEPAVCLEGQEELLGHHCHTVPGQPDGGGEYVGLSIAKVMKSKSIPHKCLYFCRKNRLTLACINIAAIIFFYYVKIFVFIIQHHLLSPPLSHPQCEGGIMHEEVLQSLQAELQGPVADLSPSQLWLRLVLLRKHHKEPPVWLTSTLTPKNHEALGQSIMVRKMWKCMICLCLFILHLACEY